jgi:hypothetical protein
VRSKTTQPALATSVGVRRCAGLLVRQSASLLPRDAALRSAHAQSTSAVGGAARKAERGGRRHMRQVYRSVALRGSAPGGWIRQVAFLDFQRLSKLMARSGVCRLTGVYYTEWRPRS